MPAITYSDDSAQYEVVASNSVSTVGGALLGGSYYVSNPSGVTAVERLTFLPFDIRMNKAAHDSLLAAMKI